MDGKIFPMGKMQAGATAPPFHPWCRGTTAPYYEDLEGVAERFARDIGTGEAYKVPNDMTYAEWKEKFVDNLDKNDIMNTYKSKKLPIIPNETISKETTKKSKSQ